MQNTTDNRTTFTKCLLIFLRQNAKKYIFLEKLTRKKMQINFIVNNNHKMIRAWYLSSKWPVWRSAVNQTNGGTSKTNLSTLLKTNIFKYTCNKEILSIQIMDKCIFFFLFRNFSLFNWRAKWVIYYFLFNRDLNRGCLIYMFSLRFSGRKFLIRGQFRVRKIFRTQVFAEFAIFSFCV